MSRKTYPPKTEHDDKFILALNRRIAFIAHKTGEDEKHIRDLLVQYGMAILSYGEVDIEHNSLLLMMLFLAGLYIASIQKGEKEINVGELLHRKPPSSKIDHKHTKPPTY